jgi:hypothetical protein
VFFSLPRQFRRGGPFGCFAGSSSKILNPLFNGLCQPRVLLGGFVGWPDSIHPQQHAFGFEYDPIGSALDGLRDRGHLVGHFVCTSDPVIYRSADA